MDPEPSQAAISAISALQKRVRELEEEKELLTNEINTLNIQVTSKNDTYLRREEELKSATARAQRMINNASNTMVLIQEERAKNNRIKENIAMLEEEINGHSENVKDVALIRKTRTCEMLSINQILQHYEIIFGEIYASMVETRQLTFIDKKALRQVNADPDLLPHPLRDIVKKLKQLPTQFVGQNMQTKRAIIQGLTCAQEHANDLIMELRQLEKKRSSSQTPRRISIEIRNLACQLLVLTQTMKRFKITP